MGPSILTRIHVLQHGHDICVYVRSLLGVCVWGGDYEYKINHEASMWQVKAQNLLVFVFL